MSQWASLGITDQSVSHESRLIESDVRRLGRVSSLLKEELVPVVKSIVIVAGHLIS